MRVAFYLLSFLSVLPLVLLSLPACLRWSRAPRDAALRFWWGLCLGGTAAWGLAVAVFVDSCLSFSPTPKPCQPVLLMPEWANLAAYIYVPLGGVVVPALWFMVFYAGVKRAQARRAGAENA